MAHITGMAVDVTVSSSGGTDNLVYLGVFGIHGGREFCLDTSKDDFKSGSKTTFIIGDLVWGTPSQRVPTTVGKDAFAHNKIGLAGVTHVYLRKYTRRHADDDDALRLTEVHVYLTDQETARTFVLDGPITLATEHGTTVWLKDKEKTT